MEKTCRGSLLRPRCINIKAAAAEEDPPHRTAACPAVIPAQQ